MLQVYLLHILHYKYFFGLHVLCCLILCRPSLTAAPAWMLAQHTENVFNDRRDRKWLLSYEPATRPIVATGFINFNAQFVVFQFCGAVSLLGHILLSNQTVWSFFYFHLHTDGLLGLPNASFGNWSAVDFFPYQLCLTNIKCWFV